VSNAPEFRPPVDPEIVARARGALLQGIDRLEEVDRRYREGMVSRRDLFRTALAVEHSILSGLMTTEEEEAVLAGTEPSRIETCQEIFCRLETVIENSFAALTLGGDPGVVLRAESIAENYLCRYEELARGEITLSAMTSTDRVLFAGSGPFPITAIEYCRQAGCRVDCVDFQPEAVRTSRDVLKRLGLDRRIRCRLARAEGVPASEYTVVLVGVLAQPKEAIFANLEATCPDGCRIIARTTFGLRGLIYRPVRFDEGKVPLLRRTGRNQATGDQVISARLYVKGAQKAVPELPPSMTR
jgi:hypothetical protein